MRRVPPDEFDRPWLVLCEGEGDRCCLLALLKHLGIEGNFQVEHSGEEGGTGGRSKFGKRLQTLFDSSQSFVDNVKAVLVVSDNDENPIDSFNQVKQQLRMAGFPVPTAERAV